jgi:hypothetical protein
MALALYWLIRMPKPKKAAKTDKQTAVRDNKAAVTDEPSRAGSSVGQNEKDTHEVNNNEARRYASIPGDTTPPRQEAAGEKV